MPTKFTERSRDRRRQTLPVARERRHGQRRSGIEVRELEGSIEDYSWARELYTRR